MSKSIHLGLTLQRSLDSTVALSWWTILCRQPHPFRGPASGREMYPAQARNLVLRDFLESDSDALLFWDSDQLPPHHVPPTKDGWQGGPFGDYLCSIPVDQGVVGGLYYSRESTFKDDGRGPHEPHAYVRQGDGYRHLQLDGELRPMLEKRGRYRVDAVATGSMLIQRRVAEAAAAKWGDEVFVTPMQLARNGLQWTEDMAFCHRASEALGEQVWLDTAMESAHLGDNIWITTQHYLAARGVLSRPSGIRGARQMIVGPDGGPIRA